MNGLAIHLGSKTTKNVEIRDSRVIKGENIFNTSREAFFEDWCQTRSLTETVKRLGSDVATLSRMSTKDKWLWRYQTQVQPKIQKATNERVVKVSNENLEAVADITEKVRLAIVERFEKGKIKPSIHEFVALIELQEKLRGNNLGEPQSGDTFIFNILEQVRDVSGGDRKTLIRNAIAAFGNPD